MSDGLVVTFRFRIGQEVLTPLDVRGVVLQRCDRGANAHDYQVCWWAESKRNVDWLLAHELREIS